MRSKIVRGVLLSVACLAVAGIAFGQFREAIKILGVGAAVRQFGPEMNRGLNRLVKHTDTDQSFTKVVPILSIGSRGAIGAAQVKGSKANVEKVTAVAAPEVGLFGNEIRLRAMIPVSDNNFKSVDDIKAVNGVGVSGIIDLKL